LSADVKSQLHDVAVIGAGAAGSIAAARLAGAGMNVLLLNAETTSPYRPGEFLTPEARARLERLGLLAADWEQHHLQVTEFLTTWGGSDVVPRNYLRHPGGHAVVLDRARFDSDLVAAAVGRGAQFLPGARVKCVTRSEGQWSLEVVHAKTSSAHCARVILACTGRSAGVLTGISCKHIRIDDLVCLGAHVQHYRGDQSPAVESYERGWVYSAGLTSGGLVINVCTEREHGLRPRELMLREIANCPIATSRLLGCETRLESDVVFFSTDASSGFTRPAAGEAWCLVGDRAQSVDPLSSSGIANAVHQAQLVSDCILRAATVTDADFSSYTEFLDDSYGEYLQARLACYSRERRWSTPFWQQRQQRRSP
jgi:flavin-dependent dehydrogenase